MLKHDVGTLLLKTLWRTTEYMDAEDFEIPPYPRYPEDGTREATENMIGRIDGKIAKLATLGLRPHLIMVGYRQELVGQLESGGPYKLRMRSAVF
jgi:hypothetical protein